MFVITTDCERFGTKTTEDTEQAQTRRHGDRESDSLATSRVAYLQLPIPIDPARIIIEQTHHKKIRLHVSVPPC